MILNDKLIALRLSSRPEFLLRLHEFMSAHKVGDGPALIAQARPAPAAAPVVMDLSDNDLLERIRAGAGGSDAWWHSFQSSFAPMPSFHGLAIVESRQDATWAMEAHRDGHFIGGVWRFPELSDQAGQTALMLGDFHGAFFSNFLTVVANALQAQDICPAYEVTATIVRSEALGFIREGDRGGRRVFPPLATQNLQWPILTADVGTPEWVQLGEQMSDAMAGAYGATIRRT